jgi:hypothetical protein
LVGAAVNVGSDGVHCCLDVILEHLFFLLGFGLSEGIVDLVQVVLFLSEQLFGLLNCIVKLDVPSVLFSLEVEVFKEFHQSFVELGDFDLGGTQLDLSLDDRDLLVLLGH